MAKWTAFPYDSADYTYDAAALKKKWPRLHAGSRYGSSRLNTWNAPRFSAAAALSGSSAWRGSRTYS